MSVYVCMYSTRDKLRCVTLTRCKLQEKNCPMQHLRTRGNFSCNLQGNNDKSIVRQATEYMALH